MNICTDYSKKLHFVTYCISLVLFITSNLEAAGYQNGQLMNFTFVVPSDWDVGTQTDERRMRKMLDVDPKYKVLTLSVYGAADSCAVIVYETVIPIGGGDAYINKLHALSAEKFLTGKNQGLVKQVVENKKTKMGMYTALLIDWVSNRGSLSHIRQWILYAPKFKNSIPAIMAHCNSKGYKATKMAIDRIASSLKYTSTSLE